MAASTNGTSGEKSYFEQQRELLINDVANVQVFQKPLSNIDANDTAEHGECVTEHQSTQSRIGECHRSKSSLRENGISNLIQSKVGNEFSQVEGLWSQFENVMAKQPESDSSKDTKDGAAEEQH